MIYDIMIQLYAYAVSSYAVAKIKSKINDSAVSVRSNYEYIAYAVCFSRIKESFFKLIGQ